MEDRKIIELYNYRSENALIETDKKYGKIVTFLICKLIKNTLDVEECRNDTYLGAWMTIVVQLSRQKSKLFIMN